MPFVQRRDYLERRRREAGAQYARRPDEEPEEDAEDEEEDDGEDEDKYVSAVHRLSHSYDDRIRQGTAVEPTPEARPVPEVTSQKRVYRDPDAVAQSVCFFETLLACSHTGLPEYSLYMPV